MRFCRIAVLLTIFAAAVPAAAGYGSASELLDAMLTAQRDRAEGVTDYVMEVEVMGQSTRQFYERTTGERAALEPFRLVPMNEVQERLRDDSGTVVTDVAGVADGMLRAFPGGGGGSGPSANPWAASGADLDPAELVRRAEIVGQESIDGRNASVVRADGLNLTQISDGAKYTFDSITMWIDADHLVMLKMRMDGNVRQRGKSREMSIEKMDRDHRIVPGSRMMLPYRSVVSIAGAMTPEQERELEQSRVQLEEFERQMASMPEDQRRMMESRMGPQIQMMRSMVESGAMELETTVREIRVNGGLSAAFARPPGFDVDPGARSGAGMPASAPASASPAEDGAALQSAREACLQRKVEAAQAKKKKKRFGKLLGSMGRIAGRHGSAGLNSDIGRVTSVAYETSATAKDLEEAADALGISQEDIAACENPESDS